MKRIKTFESFSFKLYEKFNLGKKKFYHATDKKNLQSLLNGIVVDRKDSYSQGGGFYVNTSEKHLEELEGVGSVFISLMVEVEADLSNVNFDIDYEMNYSLSNVIDDLIDDVKNKFDKSFIISNGEKDYLIFGNDITKDDFDFEKVEFRGEFIGEVPINPKKEWVYLPVQKINNKYKVIITNNIYGAPLTKHFIDRLDKIGIKEVIQKEVFNQYGDKQTSLRYIGENIIKPTRYKFKENGEWGEWIKNDK